MIKRYNQNVPRAQSTWPAGRLSDFEVLTLLVASLSAAPCVGWEGRPLWHVTPMTSLSSPAATHKFASAPNPQNQHSSLLPEIHLKTSTFPKPRLRDVWKNPLANQHRINRMGVALLLNPVQQSQLQSLSFTFVGQIVELCPHHPLFRVHTSPH